MIINTLQLGSETLTIPPIPLGRVKVLIPAINRVANGFAQTEITEETMQEAIFCVSEALQTPLAEISAMPASFPQLIAAIEAITTALGLSAKEPAAGEAQAAS